MSNVAEGTIELLQHAGIRISIEGDAIRFKGPPEALKELVPVLKEYKPILLAALQAEEKQPRTVVIDGVGWYWRSDVAGREGWERGNVRPWEAWWRRCSFEGLPEPPERLWSDSNDDDNRRG